MRRVLWAAAALASNEPMEGQAHLGGFTLYGVGWGLLGPRLPIPWHRLLAALAIGLCLVSEATLGLRALRRDPAEITRAMRVLYEGPRPANELNQLTWYWATQSHAPRAVLEMGRDAMATVVARVPTPAREDTLATVQYRLGDLERAVETERFEYARLSAVDAASLATAPFRLRRVEEGG